MKKIVFGLVFLIVGSGNLAWGHSAVLLDTSNGFGSYGTNIRNFLVVEENTGNAIKYIPDAVNGDSFEIMRDGMYSMSVTNSPGTGNEMTAVTKNDNVAQLNQTASSLPPAQRLCALQVSNHDVGGCSVTVPLIKGDVIRVHVDMATDIGGVNDPSLARFSIVRIADDGL